MAQKVEVIQPSAADPDAEEGRLSRLVDMLAAAGHGRDERGRKRKGKGQRAKVLVFTATKARAENLCMALQTVAIAAERIHGDRPQALRDAALAAFSTPGKGSVLVATDVAARGLHVDDIDKVVLYDFVQAKGDTGMEQYVHRVGRCGRAGRRGTAVSFFVPSVDGGNASFLVRALERSGADPPAELAALATGG